MKLICNQLSIPMEFVIDLESIIDSKWNCLDLITTTSSCSNLFRFNYKLQSRLRIMRNRIEKNN